MRNYLTNLIEEKGRELTDTIEIEGHIGLTYQMLVDFIATMPEYHAQIRQTLVRIDFQNGDVFDFLNHLAKGMVASVS